MKNYGLIIKICIGVVVVILTGVVLFEGYQRTKAASSQMNTQNSFQVPSYDLSSNAASQTAERKTFGNTVTESQMYMNELGQIQDDEGASELQAISSAAAGL
jgi:hypothetical protein